jgi:FHA domain
MSSDTVLVETLDSHGRVTGRERIALREPDHAFSVGRSIQADVVLDDPFAAAMHACLYVTPDGMLHATDLGSVNGIVVGGKRYHEAANLPLPGKLLQIGRTRLRVRTEGDNLDPEKRDGSGTFTDFAHSAPLIAALTGLGGALQVMYAAWVGAPQDLAVIIVTALAGTAVIVAAWVAIWGLLSRVMVGEWRWLRHAAILFSVGVVLASVHGLLDMTWFVLALPPNLNPVALMGLLAFGVLLYLHLMHASSLTPGRALQVACIVPLLLGAGGWWLQDRYQARDVNFIGQGVRIYPPALRLRAAESVDDYFRKAFALRALADKRRIALPPTDAGEE